MRILIYSPYSLRFGGGGERWILEIAPRLKKLRHEVLVVTTKFGEDELSNYILNTDFQLVEIPYYTVYMGGRVMCLPINAFQKLVNLSKTVDVLYFNNIFPFQELMMLILKRMVKKPVINMRQISLFPWSIRFKIYQKLITENIIKYFNAHHILNEYDKQFLKNCDARNIYHIPNGTDINHFKFVGSENETSNNKFRVLFVGRLNLHKGFDRLCKIIKIINSREEIQKKVEFIIAGTGLLKDDAITLSNTYNNVKYLSQIEHSVLVSVYNNSHLIILPSRIEGLPLVGVEAQACGLPCVVSNAEGAKDVLANDESGKIIDAENLTGFVKAVNFYYELWNKDRKKYNKLRCSVREHAIKKYSWDIITQQINELLHHVVNEHYNKGRSLSF